MCAFLYQRAHQSPPPSPNHSSSHGSLQNCQRPSAGFLGRGPVFLVVCVSVFVVLGILSPYLRSSDSVLSSDSRRSGFKWRDYALRDAAAYVAKNNTLIVCAVSEAYLDFLNNWLISIARQNHHEKVLVIAEDYATLDKVNQRWPGHAVLIPPALEAAAAHKFGSQGFFNFTARRPRHLLQILDLGYNVMYNDVDMVWLADPFPYFEGNYDVYFMDDMAYVKPFNHSHDLPAPGKKGRTYICSCLIYLRPTSRSKLLMRKWIEEMEDQPWSRTMKANDQPAFNWALNKTARQVEVFLLPQTAFPTGGLYFRNKTWARETKGMQVMIHNNYIIGFEKKIKRFREYGLWLVDDHFSESPLGRL